MRQVMPHRNNIAMRRTKSKGYFRELGISSAGTELTALPSGRIKRGDFKSIAIL
jgi:hypothetical protein